MGLTKAEILSVLLALLLLTAAVLLVVRSPGENRVLVQPAHPAQEERQLSFQNESERVNINAADAKQLQELPGIGEKLAQRIIAFREENGGFEDIEDITRVSGIGQETFEEIRQLITVS